MGQGVALEGELLGQIAGPFVLPHFRGAVEKCLGIHATVEHSGKRRTAVRQDLVGLNIGRPHVAFDLGREGNHNRDVSMVATKNVYLLLARQDSKERTM